MGVFSSVSRHEDWVRERSRRSRHHRGSVLSGGSSFVAVMKGNEFRDGACVSVYEPTGAFGIHRFLEGIGVQALCASEPSTSA